MGVVLVTISRLGAGCIRVQCLRGVALERRGRIGVQIRVVGVGEAVWEAHLKTGH